MSTPGYDIVIPEFRELVDTAHPPELLAKGFTWTEGPVWISNALYFNDIPACKMHRWTAEDGVTVALSDSQFANGNTRDADGFMISCEHGGRRVLRRRDPHDPAAIDILATHIKGRRLNSPNDVIVHSDTSIWFTDPPYGILSDYEGFAAESELDGNHVYRIAQDGDVTTVATDFDRPNGLALSPDERLLYVADSGAARGHGFGFDPARPHHIRVLSLDGAQVTGSRVFADIHPGVPDGLRVDTDGRIWTSTGDGIWCLDRTGNLIGRILLPDPTANLCFGGDTGTDIFATASDKIWRIRSTVRDASFR